MKACLAACALVCCCSGAYAQFIHRVNLDSLHLKGRVKMVAQTTNTSANGPLSIIKDTTWFDGRGNAVANNACRQNGSVVRQAMKYDDKGIITMAELTDGRAGVTITDLYALGRPIVTNWKHGDKITSQCIYRNDERGRVYEIEMRKLAGAGFPGGNDTIRTYMKYDDKDEKITETEYNRDRSVASKDSFVYDGKGRVAAQYTTLRGVTNKTSFQYLAKGTTAEWKTFDADGTLRHTHTTKYDKYGNEIEIVSDDVKTGSKTITTIRYDGFDQKHNWLKKTAKAKTFFGNTEKFNTTVTIERNIVYY